MHVLFAHSPPDLYGASRSLLRLSSRLVKDGHRVTVLLPSEGPLVNELIRAGVGIRITTQMSVVTRSAVRGAGKLLSFLAAIPLNVTGITRVCRELKPDVVHTNTALLLAPALAARVLRVPHIWHVREVFSDYAKIWPVYQWFMGAFASRIICVSRAVASQFHPVLRSKTVVLHNGFPSHEFEVVASERVQRFRSRFGLNGEPVVGLVGRIKLGRKGQEVLLQAAAKLKKKHPSVRYLCIGSAFPGNEDHTSRFQSLCGELDVADIVTCTGDVEDVKAAYSALDISVQPSTMPEAFSGVVVESMALGCAVVASAIGGTVEQIDDGLSGLLFKSGDPDDLANKLDALLSNENLRRSVAENARTKFLREFEFEPFYQRMTDIYRNAISQ